MYDMAQANQRSIQDHQHLPTPVGLPFYQQILFLILCIKIEAERVKYWMSKGAQPTLRVSRLLGELQIMPMPKPGNNPKKAIPKKDRKKSAEESKEAPKACLLYTSPSPRDS